MGVPASPMGLVVRPGERAPKRRTLSAMHVLVDDERGLGPAAFRSLARATWRARKAIVVAPGASELAVPARRPASRCAVDHVTVRTTAAQARAWTLVLRERAPRAPIEGREP